MVCTTGLSNVMWVLLLVNWLFEGWLRTEGDTGSSVWEKRWQMARESRLLQAFVALFFLHVIGLLWTHNLAEGLRVINHVLPLLLLPLVVLTTSPAEGNTRRVILLLYVLTVFVLTVIGFVRWLTIPDLPYRDIIPYISHIRFSLNICMVIFLLTQFSDSNFRLPFFNFQFSIPFILRLFLLLWFLFMLLLLRSYTALVILAVASLIAILITSAENRRRWRWLAIWCAVMATGAILTFLACRSYYQLIPQAREPLREYTAGGRPYEHHCDGFIENGNYVNNYICRTELLAEWPKRSNVPLHSLTSSGYPVESALIRYLNTLGLTKDSAGIAALSDIQVSEIARGVANPIYEHGGPLKKMLHVLLFEFENYRCYRAVMGFSMLQRVELWRCACRVIEQHPWLGTGTGDLRDEMHTQFLATNSPMLCHELLPHSEYLTLTALFGIPATLLLVLLFFFALRHSSSTLRRSPLAVLWLATILISFLTENTLDSLPGVLFCTWFLAFRKESR